jgi:hypothetical protein
VRRFRVAYRDDCDPGCPVFSCVIKAYDRDHVIEKFHDAPDGEGWEILSITEI